MAEEHRRHDISDRLWELIEPHLIPICIRRDANWYKNPISISANEM